MGKVIRMTNLEFIRTCDEDELALRLMCPHDIDGTMYDELPCTKEKNETPKFCAECVKKWLKEERK